VLIWDLYNEPNNLNGGPYGHLELEDKSFYSLKLLKKAYAWAREVNPDQPITTGVWYGHFEAGDEKSFDAFNTFHMAESDIISFHSYDNMEGLKKRYGYLKSLGRPLICTEYVARGVPNTFLEMLPFFKAENVGAYNWGLVFGKSQTIYPWKSWDSTFTAEPKLWHHDIFREDGSSYNSEETELIRSLTME
jgi:hypothetical protein